MTSKHEELRKLELLILDRVSLTVALASLGALPIGVWDWWTHDRLFVLAFMAFGSVTTVMASIRRFAPRPRGILLVTAIFGVGCAAFHYVGYLAVPAVTLILAVLLSYALIGERFALWLSLVASAGIVAIGGLQTIGALPVAPGRDVYAPDELGGWVRVAVIFLMMSVAILRAIGAQHRMLEQSLDEQSEALDELHARTEELQRAQEERDQAEKRVRDAERLEAIGQLAGSVAHDMNNSLTVILGCAEVLRKSARGAEDLELVEDLIFAGESGAELCRQLLSCARRSVLAPRDVDPGPFLKDVGRLFARVLPPDVVLELSIDEGLPMIHVDEAELQHAIFNLLSNARDAVGGRGQLELAASSDNGMLHVGVSDDGPGIPDEIRDRVFEPLFTTKQESGGTGLGLPSVLGCVTQSGGSLELQSEDGTGTTVRMSFPVIDGSARRRGSEIAAPPDRARILIVDDDPSIGRLLARLLAHHEFEPTIVEDAEAALRQLDDHHFDILLTDVVLPGRQGPELAELALRRRPELQIVLMTGYMDEVSARKAMDRQLQVLPKPFTNEDLLEVLRVEGPQSSKGTHSG